MDECVTCRMCGEVKPRSDYYLRQRDVGKAKKGSLSNGRTCKACVISRQRRYEIENPGRKKNSDLMRNYGISLLEFEEISRSQGGGCSICGRTAEESAHGSLCVDHDHECCPGVRSCGRCVRGLLCSRCNTAIGLLEDSVDKVFAAAEYLERWKEKI